MSNEKGINTRENCGAATRKVGMECEAGAIQSSSTDPMTHLQSQPGSPPGTHKSSPGRVCISRSPASPAASACSFLRTQTFYPGQGSSTSNGPRGKPTWRDPVLSRMTHHHNRSHPRKWVSAREETHAHRGRTQTERPGLL